MIHLPDEGNAVVFAAGIFGIRALSLLGGLWYARSAEFLQQPLLETLRWLRIIGDTVFLIGVGFFAWFMAGLWFGWSFDAERVKEQRVVALPARSAL